MGKRIMFRDADFSENGMKPIVNKDWAFGLVYESFDSTKAIALNNVGIAVYDAENCKNYNLTQHHITKIKYDAVADGAFQILKVDKNDYTKYEVLQEIECSVGNGQELEVDIVVGRNHYLGFKNATGDPIRYHNEVGNYGTGFHFIMPSNPSVTYKFPLSVIRVDFLSETETWE